MLNYSLIYYIFLLQLQYLNFSFKIACHKIEFLCTSDELIDIIMLNNKNDDDKIKIEYKATPILEKSVTFPISLIIKLSREIDIESIDTYIPTY